MPKERKPVKMSRTKRAMVESLVGRVAETPAYLA
jgi:hypothetical protein